MHIHGSYLHRMTALYAIQVLTESLDVEMLGKVSALSGGAFCGQGSTCGGGIPLSVLQLAWGAGG